MLCGIIFVLCSLIKFKAIEIVMGFPFVIICIVLVYAMAKIKSLLQGLKFEEFCKSERYVYVHVTLFSAYTVTWLMSCTM